MGYSRWIGNLLRGGTQAIKFQLSMNMTDEQHKKRVRLIAIVLGAIPTFVLWPIHTAASTIWALCVGLASPAAYLSAMKILYHFFPWLENKVSARPVVLKKDDEGNVVGFKEGDDKTKYFKRDDK